MSNYKCDFCENDKFLSKKSLVIGVKNYYDRETKEFIICSDCDKTLENAKLQVEMDFAKQIKAK